MENQTIKMKLKEFGKECLRVLKVTRKPTMKEFKTILLITGIGTLLIGLIGFLITMLRQLFF
jgi:protein transport protein SEC61 subunit gamma and related proteins